MTPKDGSVSAVILQMVQQNDDKHEAGHARLRTDYREMEQRVMALERAYTDAALDYAKMKVTADAPIDVGKIMFNPRMVLGIIGLVVSIVTGNWFTTAPLRESLVQIREQFTDNIKLQDERFKAVNDKLDNSGRQMEMRRLEIQQLNNDVQQLRRGK